MCKRKTRQPELRSPTASRQTSPAAVESASSGEWPGLSSSSSSSSVSYSSKMPNEGTIVFSTGAEENIQDVPETKAMSLVGCPQCFMYVMLSEVDPKCPKCKTTVFLEIFKDENFKTDN